MAPDTFCIAHVHCTNGGKRGAQKMVHDDPWKGSRPRYWSYLEGHWLCAGELSAVNVIIGAQLRDLINLELSGWRLII